MQQTTASEGVPSRTVSPYESLTVYGPLGIGWAITLAILAIVWRDQRAQRREFLAAAELASKQHTEDLKRREDACKAERDEFRETLTTIAKECAAASVRNGEMWRDHALELRRTLESAAAKIGSRK